MKITYWGGPADGGIYTEKEAPPLFLYVTMQNGQTTVDHIYEFDASTSTYIYVGESGSGKESDG